MTVAVDATLAEADQLLDAARGAGLEARLLGGVAVLALADGRLPEPLRRPYADIDLAVPSGSGRQAAELLSGLGYAPLQRFNAVNGDRRLIFEPGQRGNRLDVFVGEFRMCHEIPLARAFEHDGRTIPLAELLLTKLQVVRVNRKDLQDVWALVGERELGEDPSGTIESGHVADVLASDWGLWRTARGTVELARTRLASEEGLEAGRRQLIEARLGEIWEAVESRPKGLRWKARAKVGERARWYEEPDEVDHGAHG